MSVRWASHNLIEIFQRKYYENLRGGILESFGRLFRTRKALHLPMRQEATKIPDDRADRAHSFAAATRFSGVLINARNVPVVPPPQSLRPPAENHYIDSIVGFDRDILHIFSRDVLRA